MTISSVKSESQIASELSDSIHNLKNIVFMIERDYKDASLVLRYVKLADGPIQCLEDILARNPLIFRPTEPVD